MQGRANGGQASQMRRKIGAVVSPDAALPTRISNNNASALNTNSKAIRRRLPSTIVPSIRSSCIASCLILLLGYYFHEHRRPATSSSSTPLSSNTKAKANMETLVYGTNKMFASTEANVIQAMRGGYHHIATAGRHSNYDESAVGKAWTKAIVAHDKESRISISISSREELFLQTMFVADTNPDYDKNWKPIDDATTANGDTVNVSSTPTAQQVQLSIQSSLHNLQTTYLDAVLYHNLKSKLDSYDTVLQAWRELERLVHDGTIRYLGLTNVHDLDFLTKLYNDARVKPSIIQNRFHANRQFNVPLRSFIQQHSITWQAFWILTGNGGVVGGKISKELAAKKNVTPQQLIFAFVLSLGASPMIGSKNIKHLEEDMAIATTFDWSSSSTMGVMAVEDGSGSGRLGKTNTATSPFFNDGEDDRQQFAQALGKPDLVL